jgi:pectate lyase
MACISSSAWQQQAVVVFFLIAVAASQCGAVRHMGTAPSVVKLSEHNLPGTTQVENSRAAGHALANAKNTVQLTAAADDSVMGVSTNYTRRVLAGCGTGNPIDDCWRCDPDWASHRQSLADCAIGFGRNAVGGQNGQIYIVTDNSDDDVVNPTPGTLRWGAIQDEPLWIIFQQDMLIELKEELMMNSFKTLDGRGANVHIAGRACLTIQFVSNIIVHGIHIHDCVSTGPATIRSTPEHVGNRGTTDGDGINVFGSNNIWIDHNYFANCADGLTDVIEGSTAITISNNYFTNHDKVMLLGAHPQDTFDKNMEVTVAFNHFGANLVQRMPRCRFGYFHVVNNYYYSWGTYAVGGSENPTINSEGNYYIAPSGAPFKEVTKRLEDDGTESIADWESWNWRSAGDIFINGAYFTPSGVNSNDATFYAKATSFSARPASMVGVMTNDAGPLML